jgi:hypothetical protein
MADMSITVTSPPEMDNLVAELWWGDTHWGEVVFDDETTCFLLTIYPPAPEQSYCFPLADALQALERAKHRLTEMGYGLPE